jgi:eukaryotic-like serine/threonine-protein kinase
LSFGGQFANLPLAIDSRFKAAVLVIGGYVGGSPETDRVHYLPRVRVPVLLLNGRYDFTFRWRLRRRCS